MWERVDDHTERLDVGVGWLYRCHYSTFVVGNNCRDNTHYTMTYVPFTWLEKIKRVFKCLKNLGNW